MINTTDEREGLPSASNAWLMHCEGAGELIRSLPKDFELPTNKYASEGTRLHSMLENDVQEYDSSQDEYILIKSRELRGNAIEAVWGDYTTQLSYIKEKRYWLVDDRFDKLMSGKFDELVIGDGKALIIDYKTQFSEYAPAERNNQLKLLALLVFEKHGMPDIYVALIQPNLPKGKQLSISHYDHHALVQIRKDVFSFIERYNSTGRPRTTGDWCKYCTARTICPDIRKGVFDLVEASKIHELDKPTTVEILDRIDIAKKLIEDFETREKEKAMKQLQADPDSLPGYRINEGRKRREVDTSYGIQTLSYLGLKLDDAMPALTLSLPKLIKVYKTTMNTNEKKAKEDVEFLLKDHITETKSKPFIERK